MSWSHFARSWPQRFSLILASFLQKPGLPFSDVLSEKEIQAAFDAQGASFAQGDDAVYTPAVTLWAFLSQVFFKGEQRSCQAAVARVAVLMAALGKKISENTGAYCRARAKLCEAVIRNLALQVAQGSSGDSIRNYRFDDFFGPGFCRRSTRPSFFSNRLRKSSSPRTRPVRSWARNRFNSSSVTALVNKRRQLPAIARSGDTFTRQSSLPFRCARTLLQR